MRTLYYSNNHWNHYRIKSARAPWWDYGKNGIYFVTICTKHHFPFFGSIENGQMHLSKIGALAQRFWLEIPKQTLGEVELLSFVIMPNHIHGIIVLNRAEGEEPLRGDTVETNDNSSQPHPNSKNPQLRRTFFQQISPKKGSLPHLIRRFKAAVTRVARQRQWLDAEQPLWQARYYDRIVRDQWELERLSQHIWNNPSQWQQDDYYCAVPVWHLLPEKLQLGLMAAPTVPPSMRVILDQCKEATVIAQTPTTKRVAQFIRQRFQQKDVSKATLPYQKKRPNDTIEQVTKPPE